MTPRLLIEAVVRQMTVLIAEVATARGLRAPLADIADRVFLDLARELEAHGVSRTVSADMFGMALRTYLRRLHRFDESNTQRGKSLWEAVLEFIQARTVVARGDVLERFARDEEPLVRGVLQDLTDNGLIFRSGVGVSTIYRAAAAEELSVVRGAAETDRLDNLLWALIRREGPLSAAALQERTGLDRQVIGEALQRLSGNRRIRVRGAEGAPTFSAESIVLTVGERAGWEAGVYDHLHAVVKTILCKLRVDAQGARMDERIGGSTYTFVVWDGHPLAALIYGQLADFRERASELRRLMADFNEKNGLPARYDRVTVYLGQCVISEDGLDVD